MASSDPDVQDRPVKASTEADHLRLTEPVHGQTFLLQPPQSETTVTVLCSPSPVSSEHINSKKHASAVWKCNARLYALEYSDYSEN